MKQFRQRPIVKSTLMAILAAAQLVLTACVTAPPAVARREDHLVAAGFVARAADTPERQTMLQRLPANRFVQRAHDGKVQYVYADPTVCGCLYVGSQQAYDQYERERQARHLSDERRLEAQIYSDPTWNWGAWGPWGPDFAFGESPGLGW